MQIWSMIFFSLTTEYGHKLVIGTHITKPILLKYNHHFNTCHSVPLFLQRISKVLEDGKQPVEQHFKSSSTDL